MNLLKTSPIIHFPSKGGYVKVDLDTETAKAIKAISEKSGKSEDEILREQTKIGLKRLKNKYMRKTKSIVHT